jgi:hypothetical protein
LDGTIKNITTEATGPNGATVTYDLPTANDVHKPTVTCSPPSGETQMISTITVSLLAALDPWGSVPCGRDCRDSVLMMVLAGPGLRAQAEG